MRLRCQLCRETFPWDSAQPGYPKHCPCCGEFIGIPPEHEGRIASPAVRSQATKNNDKLYRDIEAGSEVRAQVAADQLGVPVSEMSDMKITNLNDRRDAEIAMIPVKNAVTEQMERANAQGGSYGFQGAPGQPTPNQTFGPGVRSGAVVANGQVVGNNIEPMAGAKTHASIKRMMGV